MSYFNVIQLLLKISKADMLDTISDTKPTVSKQRKTSQCYFSYYLSLLFICNNKYNTAAYGGLAGSAVGW